MFRVAKSLFGLPLVFMLVVSACVYLPRDLYRASWPTVSGTVIRAQRVWHVTNEANGKGFPVAQITYEYQVDGHTYQSDRYAAEEPEGAFATESGVKKLLDRHHVGSTVTVHYLANEPAFAVLHPTMSPGMWCFVVTANFLLGMILRINWACYRVGWPRRRGVRWTDVWGQMKYGRKEAA